VVGSSTPLETVAAKLRVDGVDLGSEDVRRSAARRLGQSRPPLARHSSDRAVTRGRIDRACSQQGGCFKCSIRNTGAGLVSLMALAPSGGSFQLTATDVVCH
jgi:predicted alpha/beta-hydrolase family hydrolase